MVRLECRSRVSLRSPGLRRRNKKKKKEAERRETHGCMIRALRRARQRSFGSARLSAFHRGSRPRDYSSQRLSVRPCFLGLGRSVWSCTAASTGRRRPCAAPRALPAPEKQRPVPVQRSTSHAGHSAGRMMPKPPESGSDEPPRAGTALAPPAAVTRPASLTGARGRASTARAMRVKRYRRADGIKLISRRFSLRPSLLPRTRPKEFVRIIVASTRGQLRSTVGVYLNVHVMAGLVPAIHVFGAAHPSRRGCPRRARA